MILSYNGHDNWHGGHRQEALLLAATSKPSEMMAFEHSQTVMSTDWLSSEQCVACLLGRGLYAAGYLWRDLQTRVGFDTSRQGFVMGSLLSCSC